MKWAPDAERDEFLVSLFRQSNLAPAFAEAREIYGEHVTAKSAVRYARRLPDPVQLRDAERHANKCRARWRRCRTRFRLLK